MQTTIDAVRERLISQGYDGLFCPAGKCGCQLNVLAPCGNAVPDDEGWINGCKPGYKHVDPRDNEMYGKRFGDWAIFASQTEPTHDEWDLLTFG